MADGQQTEPVLDLSPDPVIKDLTAHRTKPPGVAALLGYLGDGPDPDHVRLYFSLDMKTYCDIPRTAVVRREKTQRAGLPGASFVFVSSTLKLRIVREDELEASYLEGGIASSYPLTPGPGGQPSRSLFPNPQIDDHQRPSQLCGPPPTSTS